MSAERRREHEAPEGFVYQAEFLSADEEAELLTRIEGMQFSSIEMRGMVAKRRAIHLGLDYDYTTFKVTPGPPVPEFLLPVRERVGGWIGAEANKFVEVLIQEYP